MTDVDILLAAVRAQARVLKLPTVGHDCDPLARQALAEAWPPLQYLRSLFDAELATRAERAIERRLHAARLPAQKTLAQFDWKRAHGLERARVEELGRCAWIPTARNVVLLGPVGTGKTHLATALGIEAIKRGHHVAFYRASDLVRALTEARDTRVLSRLQERLRRVALLIVDELGFVPFEKAGGELLFDVLSTRHERGATIMTSNLAFSEWNRVFVDDKLTAALLDRLAQHADVLVTRGPGDPGGTAAGVGLHERRASGASSECAARFGCAEHTIAAIVGAARSSRYGERASGSAWRANRSRSRYSPPATSR